MLLAYANHILVERERERERETIRKNSKCVCLKETRTKKNRIHD
jgi:hypothetical protein